MLIVPLAKDLIVTKDDIELEVISYTNFKKAPAVYACDLKNPSSQLQAIYFFDIDKVNGVKVQYNESQKVLRALGVIKRKYHLPQPRDTIIVLDMETEIADDEIHAKVEKLKLHVRDETSRGLQIGCDNDKSYRLEDIVGIKHAVGGSHFDRKKFLKYYEDYRGHIAG